MAGRRPRCLARPEQLWPLATRWRLRSGTWLAGNGRGASFRRALCSHCLNVLRSSAFYGRTTQVAEALLAPAPLVPYAGRERRRLLADAHKLERSWRPEPQAQSLREG